MADGQGGAIYIKKENAWVLAVEGAAAPPAAADGDHVIAGPGITITRDPITPANATISTSTSGFNMLTSIVPFTYTCQGLPYRLDPTNGRPIAISTGLGTFSMPSLGINLNSIQVRQLFSANNLPFTYASAILPVGTWDLYCSAFGNSGVGSGEASDDDKYGFLMGFYERKTSVAGNQTNVVAWLMTKGFGYLQDMGNGQLASARGHAGGHGFATKVS